MVCPKCKSPDISTDKSNPLIGQMGLPTKYVCNNCEYAGYSFPEVDITEIEKFEEDAAKTETKETGEKPELVDTNYGKYEVRLIWKISSVALIIISLANLYFFRNAGNSFILSNSITLILGFLMFYVTYFKKRKLSED
jgi:hypothetical protein